MGECVYYLKAEFEDEQKAKAALETAEKFLARVYECADRWQDNRSHDINVAQGALAALKEEYHDVFEGLGLLGVEADPGLNCLAGELNAPDLSSDGDISQMGSVVFMSGTVWHGADWTGFEEYFRKLGAIAVGWISEEDAGGPWDQIEMRYADENS